MPIWARSSCSCRILASCSARRSFAAARLASYSIGVEAEAEADEEETEAEEEEETVVCWVLLL